MCANECCVDVVEHGGASRHCIQVVFYVVIVSCCFVSARVCLCFSSSAPHVQLVFLILFPLHQCVPALYQQYPLCVFLGVAVCGVCVCVYQEVCVL